MIGPLMRWGGLFAFAWGGGLVGTPAAAQQVPDSDCNLVDYRVLTSREVAPGRRITSVGRPDVSCPDGTRIRADSAVIHQDVARYELLGNVQYESPERELRAALVDYFEREERIFARERVELRDRAQGSEVRGDTLDLLLAGELRDEDDLTVWGDRASALLPAEEDPDGADDAAAEPYRIVADWMRFEGERFLRAEGVVEVDREGMRTSSDALTFHRDVGELTLMGQARLEAEDATFFGERILVVMPEDELRTITVHERGRLVSDDLEVLGEEIRVSIEEERIQRLVAVDRGRAPAPRPEDDDEPRDPPGDPVSVGEEELPPGLEQETSAEATERPRPREGLGPRPHAVTDEFFLIGDSIDVRSPDEVLETIHAVGFAWSETRPVGAPPPDPWIWPSDREVRPGEGIGALDRDWIEGDTILATFVPAPPRDEPAAPAVDAEEERREYVLDRLVATGSAAALYRSPPEGRDEDAAPPTPEERARWAVSYVLADNITLGLLDGRMERVDARGNLRGVQLDPLEPEASDEEEDGEAEPEEEPVVDGDGSSVQRPERPEVPA